MDKTKYYLDIAVAVAKRSHCLKSQYGAVIVNYDEIIATGYNGNPRGEKHCITCNRMNAKHGEKYDNCRAVHAEQNAIISASRQEMQGAILYLVHLKNGVEIPDAKPCNICNGMIKNSGIRKVIVRNGQN